AARVESTRVIDAHRAAEPCPRLRFDVRDQRRAEREGRVLFRRSLLLEEESRVDVCALAPRLARQTNFDTTRPIVKAFVAAEEQGGERAAERQWVPPVVRRHEVC